MQIVTPDGESEGQAQQVNAAAGKLAEGQARVRMKPMSELFDHKEIYPAKSKLDHFSHIGTWFSESRFAEADRELDWTDVLFFDDEVRNKDVERELGVCFWLVDESEGISREVFDQAVGEWRRRKGLGKNSEEGVVN